MGSSNVNLPILMNGGIFVLRNTRWARSFMLEWWTARCSHHDQLPLWRTHFRDWARLSSLGPARSAFAIPSAANGTEGGAQSGGGGSGGGGGGGGSSSASSLFSDYASARGRVLPHVIRHRAEVSRAPWRCVGACGEALEATGCLTEPLLMGRLHGHTHSAYSVHLFSVRCC